MIRMEVAQGVARLTLASPPVNALSPQLLGAVVSALDSLEHRDDWQVLAIASDQEVFCAGGDLHTMSQWMASDAPGASIASYAREVQQLCRRLEQLPQVTVAQCEQSALGGGLELALACDLRIASGRAKFGLPEVTLGLLPGAGGTQRLTRLCGKAAAAKLILAAEVVNAQEALQMGIVQWVFPPQSFEQETAALLARIAALPANAARECKACINEALEPGDRGFERELRGIAQLAESASTRDLVGKFLQRRAGSKV